MAAVSERAERMVNKIKNTKGNHKLDSGYVFSSMDYPDLLLNSYREWLKHPKCGVLLNCKGDKI